ncbi:DUF4383 domain-containing protein [Pseudonocardia sp. HH130630-07]|uniref:DUF4383 domain-containing protein n=1 Tax=Pseudonocardia sp. HH130630-07 TaxID=1690815 RepID=UPI0008150496|nr:DUF4383 domain-containing protein [Pseudonocardia sp. HH130630-07]ANY06308.1 hypothetical protein AFB00_08380 [Pseudonocardia sp. HH130630-07]
MSLHGSDPRLLNGLHRISSALVGVILWIFGTLGFSGGLGFFTTSGAPLLGMSTNNLLSTISLVVGTVLVAAGIRGGRFASTVGVVVGAAFLLSGVANVLVLGTAYNILSFRMPNVVFSLVVGLLLLTLAAYGRFSGRLPDDNPYAAEQRPETDSDREQQLPRDAADIAAARSLAETERLVAAGGGTEEQRRMLAAADAERDQAGRRTAWRRERGDTPSG